MTLSDIRMRWVVLAGACLAALSSAVVAAETDRIDRWVPASSLVYLRWSGAIPELGETGLGRLAAEPEVRRFLAHVVPLAGRYARRYEAGLPFEVRGLAPLLERPIGLAALADIGGRPPVAALVAVDLGGADTPAAAALDRFLDDFTFRVKRGLLTRRKVPDKITGRKGAEIEITRVRASKDVTIEFTTVGDVFLFALGGGTLERVLDPLTPRLTETSRYTDAYPETPKGAEVASLWIDARTLKAAALPFAERGRGLFTDLVRAAGLDEARTAGVRIAVVERRFVTSLYVRTRGRPGGIWREAAGEGSAGPTVPRGADVVLGHAGRPKAEYELAHALVAWAGAAFDNPSALGRFERLARPLASGDGVPLGTLAGRGGLVVWGGLGAAPTAALDRMVFVQRLGDPDRTKAALDELAAELTKPDGETPARYNLLRTVSPAGVRLLAKRGRRPAFGPSWTVTDDRLVIGLSPRAVENYLMCDGLAAQPSAEAGRITLGRALADLYDAAVPALALAPFDWADDVRRYVDFTRFPPGGLLRRHIGPVDIRTRVSDRGISIEAAGDVPFPPVALVVHPVTAFLVVTSLESAPPGGEGDSAEDGDRSPGGAKEEPKTRWRWCPRCGLVFETDIPDSKLFCPRCGRGRPHSVPKK